MIKYSPYQAMPETSASGVDRGPLIGMGIMACSGGGVGVTSLTDGSEGLDMVRAAILVVEVVDGGVSNIRQPEDNKISGKQRIARELSLLKVGFHS